ncbi:cytochrome b/b6 domain-containing protein [Paraglaciecola aquimarina]|uniref:Cytochrome b/b6 domain-containing protein n=1 Tax=Paraglaciecola algarum TaxID=3050085 RepID=A0ABS9DA11_9ALTE|nr:cytochrome b/b6 domain-containing protein [Paraglaciecola sp. G1-23]MCF2948848.1 cytochrome b/b6 domain-containing protein [Paraglaciecola sp. G1-23]
MKKIKIWDSPTRLFHWALVINIIAAWYTIENRLIELHEIAGHTLIALLVFRVCWGFVGSTTARFSHFITHPISALQYLVKSLKLKVHHKIGHNPAGGWMIVIMMLVIGFQLISGLLANNDLGFSGALSDYVSKATSDRLTQLHGLNFDLLVAIIWVHLVAVFFYVLVKRDNLVKAMITGFKILERQPAFRLRFASMYLAVSVFLLSAGLSAYLYYP